MGRVLAVGRAAVADGAGGDMEQAMRKAPLSRALAKSREVSGVRSGKKTKGRRQKDQTLNSQNMLILLLLLFLM